MKSRIMTREMINSLNLEVGDKVKVTVNEAPYTQIGDIATLAYRDEGGDWWGDIEDGEEDICLTDVGVIVPLPKEEPDGSFSAYGKVNEFLGNYPTRPEASDRVKGFLLFNSAGRWEVTVGSRTVALFYRESEARDYVAQRNG